MKALLPLLIVLLLSASMIYAQETPEASDWITEERCITAPSQPPEGWTYDGVIFTFIPGDGVHARRADVATRYYVAFDSDSEFGIAGSFSPDGRWLAVPAGESFYNYSLNEFDFGIDEYRIYSTAPAHTMYHAPVRGFGSGQSALHVAGSSWLDNQRVFLFGYGPSPLGRGYIFDLATQTISQPENIPSPPDTVDSQPGAFEPFLRPIQWTGNGSHFAAKLANLLQIGIFDRSGQLNDIVPLELWPQRFSYASSGKYLAFPQPNNSGIHIADFATRTITDTCIETPYSIAFSPDGRQLAFGLEPAGYVYILDIPAWEAYRIDLAAADVIGWYPLE